MLRKQLSYFLFKILFVYYSYQSTVRVTDRLPPSVVLAKIN